MKRYTAAMILALSAFSLLHAEEMSAFVLKVEGKNVTFRSAKKGETPVELTMAVTKDAIIAFGKLNKDTKKYEADMPVEGGLTHVVFTSGKTPVRLTINANRDRVTQVIVVKSKKKV